MKQHLKIPFWRNKKTLPVFLQIVFAVIIATLGAFFIFNALHGLKKIGITLGFDFLQSNASFSITDKLISFESTDSYGRALVVGLLNTLKVSVIGIIVSAVLGLLIGIARLSDNWLIRKLSGGFVEIVRNTPLLVQIFFLYFAVFLTLPKIEQSYTVFDSIFFSNRGIAIPWFNLNGQWLVWLIMLIAGIIAAAFMWKRMLKKQIDQGKRTFPLAWSIGAFIIALAAAYAITLQSPLLLTMPSINGRLFEGGYVITSEFGSILFGLIIYTSAFVAEIVRGGIQAVPKGQVEAAKALGLKKSTVMRLIILPQAVRIMAPPMTSEFLNLVKNSTLAIAVGFTDLFSVGNTIINQTGRSVEIILLIAVVYLTVSLIISYVMNLFNRHFQLVER